MSAETMQPPPCPDHEHSSLNCPKCAIARRAYYEELATSLSADQAAGEPTSARLRRVEQERDQIYAALKALRRKYETATESTARAEGERDLARAELASAKTELTHLRRERDQLRADLTEALDEIGRLHGIEAAVEVLRRDKTALLAERNQLKFQLHTSPGWIVAHNGGRNCLACGHEISRGQAYRVDTANYEPTHVHCPEVTP